MKFRSLMVFCMGACLILACQPSAMAKNPITNYFSKFLDESQPEVAIGNILLDGLVAESSVASSPDLDKLAAELGKLSLRPQIEYRVLVLDSRIPGEIPLPGGPIILTKGTLELIQNSLEKRFLVARNVVHIALRHPMMALKKENLYAKILRMLKKNRDKIDPLQRQQILRDYIKATTGMDQVKADKEGIILAGDPVEGKKAALDFLKRWSKELLPVMPWETLDLPTRVQALEAAP